jgi:hypothetical protein
MMRHAVSPASLTGVVLPLACTLAPLALIYAGVLPHVVGIGVAAVALAWCFWLLRDQIHSVILMFLSVSLVSTIATQPWPKVSLAGVEAKTPESLVESWSASGRFDETLPIVLHLAFDEMMSPGAITNDLPGGAETRQALHDLADRHGLRTFDAVYSRDFFSGVALPNLMETDYRAENREPGDNEILSVVSANSYFAEMGARGYRTIVFQTSHLNFCASGDVDACETFDSFDSADVGRSRVNVLRRSLRLSHTLLTAYEPSYASTYGRTILRKFSGLDDRAMSMLGLQDRYDVEGFPRWFSRFARFVTDVPRGTHVFAHFMVPHAPYLLTSECELEETSSAGYYLRTRYADETKRTEARLRYYDKYLAQLRCLQQKLDELLSALRTVQRFHDATIIIHGDHGSRISAGNVIEDLERQDLIDNYATYFAVKAPEVQAGIDCSFLALPQAFRRYLGPTGASPLAQPIPLRIMVSSRERAGASIEVSMPRFGCAIAAGESPENPARAALD